MKSFELKTSISNPTFKSSIGADTEHRTLFNSPLFLDEEREDKRIVDHGSWISLDTGTTFM